MNETHQIFVLGSPRSGTSVLGSTIRKALGLSNKISEFHLFSLYNHLKKGLDDFYELPTTKNASQYEGMLLHEIDKNFLEKRIKRIMRVIYKEALDEQNFVDKTPGIEMVKGAVEILKVWPNSKIIYAKRRGLENVASRLVKFQKVEFENHCNQWAQTMEAWHQVKQQITNQGLGHRIVEIDQFEIANEPQKVARQLVNFLKIDADQLPLLKKEFSERRPERTSESYLAKSIDEFGWDETMKQTFKEKCSGAMERFNYSYTNSYFKS